MKSKIALLILIPLFVLNASKISKVSAPVLPPDDTKGSVPVPSSNLDNNYKPPVQPLTALVGRVDTVGGTVYDWQANGPSYQWIVNDPEYGLHITWMRSITGVYPTFTDRNMGYNFYDYTSRQWSFNDPANYMNSGVNVFTERAGFGNIDVNPQTHRDIISGHLGTTTADLIPTLARDLDPGLGIFEYCSGTPTLEPYLWPPLAITGNQFVHLALVDKETRNNLYYARQTAWCSYEDPIHFARPTFPTHNIAASKVSDKVAITRVDSGGVADPGYYHFSTDGGNTWTEIQLPFPPAYGADTVTSFHITSLSPFFDLEDNLHIAASVMPYVRDTGYILPAEIWDYCPTRTPVWSRVHRADADTLAGSIGFNAIFATRPTLSQNTRNRNLYCVWEEFDPLNVEPTTQRLRADIYVAGSTDNGATWLPAVKLTDPDETSKRFPSAATRVHDDTLNIIYEVDLQAGFYVQNEGNSTNNPIVVHKVIDRDIIGIAETKPVKPTFFSLNLVPNPFAHQTKITYTLPVPSRVNLRIFDISGREVRTLINTSQTLGEYSAIWDGRDNNGSRVPPGVYFTTLKTNSRSFTKKLSLIE